MPAVRPAWADLPDPVRAHAAALLGISPEHVTAAGQDGGFTPGAALRLAGPDGRRLFLKAIPADHPLAGAYRAEAATLAALPAAALRPEPLHTGDIDGWVVLALQDIEGRHADLRPGSPDIPLVVAALAQMAAVLDPAPIAAATVAVPDGWRALTADDLTGPHAWAKPHLDELAALEQQWADHAAGTALIHNDIRPDNLLVGTGQRVTVVDWAQARRGHSWRDTASLVPHLIMAGHSPAAAEAAVSGLLWDAAGQHITGNAVALAGYLIRSAPLPAPPNVPHLRPYQARAALAVSQWIRHRTRW